MAKIIDTHFADEATTFTVEQGMTIEEIVRACEIPEAIWSNVVIVLNGTEVVRSEWKNVFPTDADVLSVHVVPLGSDGKQILRLVAVIAVAIAAPQLVAAAGLTGTTATVATAALTVVGTLAVNALIPPPTIRPNIPGGSATSNAYFLSGQSNRIRPYEIVPVTYGEHRMFANLASAPHIFSAGTSSIFQAVYDWGVGSYELSNVIVGETPWWMFKNRSQLAYFFEPQPYSSSATSAFRPVDLQIYDFPLKSTDLSIGLNELGDNGTSRTVDECHTAVVELTFPQGLVYFDDVGESQGNRVKYRIGYRPAGGLDFGPLPSLTRGYAGDSHLSFYGVDEGPPDGGGPIQDYTPVITPSVTSINPGDPLTLYVRFYRGEAFPGESFASDDGDPDRPKEAFRFRNITTGEVYNCTSTFNSLNPADYNPNQWAYNEMPSTPNNYIRIDQTQAHAGTMIYQDPPANNQWYAFELVAPNSSGRFQIEMDLAEWWTKPYGEEGAVRCAETEDYYPVTLNDNIVTLTVRDPVITDPNDTYKRTGPDYSYVRRDVYSQAGSGDWEERGSQMYVIWWQGSAYTYDVPTQHDYVGRSILGTSRAIESVQVTFGGYSAWEFLGVKGDGVLLLISEGVLTKVISNPDGGGGPDGGVDPDDGGNTTTPDPSPPITNPDTIEPFGGRLLDPNDDWFDGGTWNPSSDSTGTLFTVYGSEATPSKISIVIPMPQVGAYDIRIERIDDRQNGGAFYPSPPFGPGEEFPTVDPKNTDEDKDSRYIDDSMWTRLASRGIPEDTAVLNLQHRHTLTELEFEANQAIQGNVQEVSAILRSRLRTWRNGAWTGLTLRDANGEWCYDNPAWIVADILLGYSIQNKRAPRFNTDHCGWLTPDQLDMQSFYDFAQHCNEIVAYTGPNGYATRKRYTTNMVMASDAPIIETVQNILGQCRAQLIINQSGRLSVMLDEARTTPRQMFTPSNSWDFSGSRSFTEIPHCFNVQFTSPELGWQVGTVKVYRPGYDATGSYGNEVASVFEDLDTIGITNAHQAQLYGAYMLAQAVIRNETFTLSTDVENLVCQRGDLVEVAHDAPLMGGRSAVVTGEVDGWLHISEAFDGLSSETNSYTLRTSGGDVLYGSVLEISADKVRISNQGAADVGNLIVIGPSNRVTEKYLIQSIRPKPDLTAELSLVKYDERVYQVDDGQFPVWNPNFNQNIGSGGTHQAYSPYGTSELIYIDRQPYTEAVINWSVWPDNDSVGGFLIEMQTLGNARRQLDYVAGGSRSYTHRYSSRDSSLGGSTTYFITPYSALGYKGVATNITLSKRIDTVAPYMTGFRAEFTANNNTLLTWDDPNVPDLQGYSIYYKPDPINPGFGGEKIGQPAYNRTDWLVEGAKEGLFWIVATDTSGNNSNPRAAGSYDTGSYPTPDLVQPFWIDVFEDRVGGMLHWELLDDPTIASYTLYQSYEPAEFDIERATRLATVGPNVDQLAVERPFGAFWIVAENVYGVVGPANRIVEYYRTPAKVQNFRLYVEQNVGVLRWDLLSDVYLDRYELRYTEDAGSTDAESAAPFGSAAPNTDNMPSEKLEGAWFIRGVNIYGIAGPWSDTNSVVEGLAAVNGKVTQALKFIGRYPFSDATVSWQLQGSQSLLEKYRVFFYPTDPVKAQTYQEPDEVVVDRPPVLVYEGPETRFTTTVSTTEDTGRQHGYFAILPISIYGTAGVAEYVDFEVIKDVTPPLPPERFFVNIVSNTNADLSWLASQSVDVDTYDLRYTPEYSSPRWEAAEHIATVGFNVTGYQTNARTGTYLIRATDTSGNVSDVVMQRTTVAELPDMNIVERVEDAPDWEGKKVYFIKDGSRLLMQNAPYTGGDDFGADPYREATYYYHERVDLGRIYETRLTAKIQAYGQLAGSVMADWNTLAEIDPISGVEESADWDCWVEYRTGTQEDVIADWVTMAAQDPISGTVASDWTEWRAFFAADVTARFIDFRIVARAYNPNAEVGVISGLIEVDMPDRYWTKSDIPVGVSGASVLIDPPFKHLEAVAVTVDGNDYNVRAIVEDKKPWGFTVKLINQTNGAAVPGQVDVFASGYGIERPEVI